MTKRCEADDLEWVTWAAIAGRLELEDGRRVWVRGGDDVLMRFGDNETATFVDHCPATRH